MVRAFVIIVVVVVVVVVVGFVASADINYVFGVCTVPREALSTRTPIRLSSQIEDSRGGRNIRSKMDHGGSST